MYLHATKCFMQNFTFIAFCVNIFAKITVGKKTVIGWIQGPGYFFYMLRDISRSYLGFPLPLRWLFPLNLTRLFCCFFLLLLPGQLELNLCKLPKPAKNARNCGLDQIEHSKHNIEIVSLFDLKRINGWWPATGTKDGEQILAVSDIVVSAHAHAGFSTRLSQAQTNQ